MLADYSTFDEDVEDVLTYVREMMSEDIITPEMLLGLIEKKEFKDQ